MFRAGEVFYENILTGVLKETDSGYSFIYDEKYFANKKNYPISLLFPLTKIEYKSKTMFSFFDGLIPEGWLLNIATKNWKINPNDRMGLLLTICEDCIGAVSIKSNKENIDE